MIRRGLLTFLVLQLAYSGLSWACTCSQLSSYADYDQVFVGRAERSAVGCDGTQHTQFIVTEAIEGVSALQSVTVHHSPDPAACGVAFEPGQTWLIATSSESSYSQCSPGGPDPTEDDIADAYSDLAQ